VKISVAIVALMFALVAGASASSASLQRTPQSLYSALLTKPFPDSQLPSGFSSARVTMLTPSSGARRYHPVGEVAVAVDGPDPDDGFSYGIFTKHSDALSELNHPTFSSSEKLRIVPGGVPGFPKLPGHMWTGSVTGKNVLGKTITNGLTIVAVVQGNVIVDAFTGSADNMESGNVPAAIALLRSALKHLAKV